MPCIVSGLKHAIKVGRPICVRVRHVELQLLLFVWFNPAKPSPFRNHRTVFQYLTVGARVWFNGQTETRTWIVESTGSIFFSMAPICTFFFQSLLLCGKFSCVSKTWDDIEKPDTVTHRSGAQKRCFETKFTDTLHFSDAAACCKPSASFKPFFYFPTLLDVVGIVKV